MESNHFIFCNPVPFDKFSIEVLVFPQGLSK